MNTCSSGYTHLTIYIFLNMFVLSINTDNQLVSFQVATPAVYQKINITMTCELNFTMNDDSVYVFKLLKNTSGIMREIFLLAYSESAINKMFISWSDSDLQSRADISGSAVVPRNEAKMVFTVPKDKTICSDEGNYTCLIDGYAGTHVNVSASKRLEVLVEPSIVDIRTEPSQSCNMFCPGTIVRFICNGTVGDPPAHLTWCYKRSRIDLNFIEYPFNENISEENPIKNDCQYNRQSVLSYTVLDESPTVTFRCIAGWKETCATGTAYTSHTINIYILIMQNSVLI